MRPRPSRPRALPLRQDPPRPAAPIPAADLTDEQLLHRVMTLPDRRLPPEDEVSVEEWQAILGPGPAPAATPKPPARSRLTARRPAVAAMTRRANPPLEDDIDAAAPGDDSEPAPAPAAGAGSADASTASDGPQGAGAQSPTGTSAAGGDLRADPHKLSAAEPPGPLESHPPDTANAPLLRLGEGPTAIAAPLKKPAGWKATGGDFWTKGAMLRMCCSCGLITSTQVAELRLMHKPSCDKYPRDARVSAPVQAAREVLGGRRSGALTEALDALGRYESPPMLRPVEKPKPPRESPAYRKWTSDDECINPGCHAAPPNDPHHEDADLIPGIAQGVGQKRPDVWLVTLCRFDHEVYTGVPGHPGGCLPDPEETRRERKLILRSPEETRAILRRALDERMQRALQLLPQEERIRAMARGLVGVPEEVFEAALLGEPHDEPPGAEAAGGSP